MKKLMLLGAAAAFLAACGDPRANVIGSYNVTVTVSATSGGQTSSQTGTDTVTIAADTTNANGITFSGNCGLTAKMNGGNAFTIDPKTCPVSTDPQSGCQSTLTVTNGSGTVTGKNLSLTYNGTVHVACPDNSTADGTVTATATGTKP